MTYIDPNASAQIRAALADGPLTKAELEQRLEAAGQDRASTYIIPMARAGLIAGRDLFDAQGVYLGCELRLPGSEVQP